MTLILDHERAHKQGKQGAAEQGREFGGDSESVHDLKRRGERERREGEA